MAAIGLPAIIIGGPVYALAIALLLGGSAWEYVRMFQAAQLEALIIPTVGGTLLILAARSFFPQTAGSVLTFLILLAMTIHLIRYERGRNQAAADFGITLGGILYLGWVGSYLVDLRNLPGGLWWSFLALGSVWFADTGAYFIGMRWGRSQFSQRLSPHKSWEGYIAGLVSGALGGAILAWCWYRFVGLDVNALQGALVGFVITALAPLGDLGESMFKRFSNFKDSGKALPGHGGFFDRIDSWLWAATLGYFLITWFIL
jgi:phosphatidate cytidylyltransferase